MLILDGVNAAVLARNRQDQSSFVAAAHQSGKIVRALDLTNSGPGNALAAVAKTNFFHRQSDLQAGRPKRLTDVLGIASICSYHEAPFKSLDFRQEVP
jgi:hypothetical protein